MKDFCLIKPHFNSLFEVRFLGISFSLSFLDVFLLSLRKKKLPISIVLLFFQNKLETL